MPIDLNQIPPKADPAPRGPSLLALLGTFVVLTLFGVSLVLLGWPRARSTNTLTFWLLVAVAPPLGALVVTLIPYWWHAGKVRNVRSRNEVRDKREATLFAHASRPLAVLGASYYISPSVEENDVNGIATGKLVLSASPLPDRSGTARARWLDAPAYQEGEDVVAYDESRQSATVQKIYRQLLDELTAAIKSVPQTLPLRVELKIETLMPLDDCEAWWLEEWNKRGLPKAKTSVASVESSVKQLDTWLDAAGKDRDYALLSVALQLHPLMSETPPKQSAEAGVALLLAPEEVAMSYTLPRIASVHRPNSGTLSSIDHTLKYALVWGSTTASDVGYVWHTGFDENSERVLSNALKDAAATSKSESSSIAVRSLDQSVGHAGLAHMWLAVACAAKYVPWNRSSQLIAGLNRESVDMAVVRPPNFT